MFYYEVAPIERSYKGKFLPTYSSDKKLDVGQIISVHLRSKSVFAFVVSDCKKPDYNVKTIDKVYLNYKIPFKNIQFFKWLDEYYPGSLGSTASLFSPANIIEKSSNTNQNNDDNITTNKFELSKKQMEISSKINNSNRKIHIIHGDTGTGKTRIYMDLCLSVIKMNKSIIFLTPEISLTPQLSKDFEKYFKNVYIIHSQLTPSERRKVWLKVSYSTDPVIIIGPRSALFMPVNNIGLIVIDEFHDSAYKQDQAPKFQTVRIASQLAKIHSCKLVLGSATPPIEDFFYATKKGAEVHRITEIPTIKAPNRTLTFVDISDKNQLSQYDSLSKTLLDKIAHNLERSQQSLVFLNKRGSSRTITCENCGWIAVCPRCNIPYVYHQDKNYLLCHTCGNKTNIMKRCPDCNNHNLIYKNPGTKQIEANLKKLFPSAKIGRYDKDNTKTETFSAMHSDIMSGNIDILVGTQLLSKGHDLPKLSLVGILNADSGLQIPDYSSAEKNFQILEQIIGRVGRGHLPGEVVIQTYGDKNKLSKLIEQNNYTWQNFYKEELKNRQKFNYPPYCFMLKIEISRKNEDNLIKNISEFANKISKNYPNVDIIGPAPSLISKRNNNHYWQIIIKSKNRSVLKDIINNLPNNCSYDLDPINLI